MTCILLGDTVGDAAVLPIDGQSARRVRTGRGRFCGSETGSSGDRPSGEASAAHVARSGKAPSHGARVFISGHQSGDASPPYFRNAQVASSPEELSIFALRSSSAPVAAACTTLHSQPSVVIPG